MDPKTEESFHDLLGRPTDTSKLTVDDSLNEVSFNLYRETLIVITVAASITSATNKVESDFPRNQAIEVGYIVRIGKYMSAVLALQIDLIKNHGEVILTLNRCISESALNLLFFCKKGTEEDYDNFVKSSLRPEKELYDVVKANIASRGTALPIENRILISIRKTLENSGIKNIEDIGRLPARRDFKKILISLGMGAAYPMFQGVPSHAVHGTWVDLEKHHLEKSSTGFSPKLESIVPDPRLFLPICMLVLRATKCYVKKYFSLDSKEIDILLDRIEDLMMRIKQMDNLHEKKLSKN